MIDTETAVGTVIVWPATVNAPEPIDTEAVTVETTPTPTPVMTVTPSCSSPVSASGSISAFLSFVQHFKALAYE